MQDILPIDMRHNVDEEKVDMSHNDTVYHISVGSSDENRNDHVREWQVNCLDGNAPNVGGGCRVTLGPYIQNVINHGACHELGGDREDEANDRLGDDHHDGSEYPHEQVIGSAAACASVEGAAGFVISGKGD